MYVIIDKQFYFIYLCTVKCCRHAVTCTYRRCAAASSYKVVNMHEALGGGRFAPSQFFWKHFFPVNLQIGILKDPPPRLFVSMLKIFSETEHYHRNVRYYVH